MTTSITSLLTAAGPILTVIIFGIVFWWLGTWGRLNRMIARAPAALNDALTAKDPPIMYSIYLNRTWVMDDGTEGPLVISDHSGLYDMKEMQPVSAEILVPSLGSHPTYLNPEALPEETGSDSSTEPSPPGLLARLSLAPKRPPPSATSPAVVVDDLGIRLCVSIIIAMPCDKRNSGWVESQLPEIVVGCAEAQCRNLVDEEDVKVAEVV
ncbi:hypothetical protein FRB94_003203 [Tulasnella sp. JGI-2019a]|nr:hypothetical protein FRB94_003203 [Tulasnella sp. JGI-2019a]KAG9028904.1 hypothetical protein FRB95_005902 [Tulasnella sp. JGI-2019a]